MQSTVSRFNLWIQPPLCLCYFLDRLYFNAQCWSPSLWLKKWAGLWQFPSATEGFSFTPLCRATRRSQAGRVESVATLGEQVCTGRRSVFLWPFLLVTPQSTVRRELIFNFFCRNPFLITSHIQCQAYFNVLSGILKIEHEIWPWNIKEQEKSHKSKSLKYIWIASEWNWNAFFLLSVCF